MFLIFNKDKIISCMVALGTIVILFLLATTFNSNNSETVETATSSSKLLPIYNVNTEEKKVALTINCAWNADDIDLILETLKKHEVKITFFVVGDWVEKYPDAVKKIDEAGHEIRKSFIFTPTCK